MFHKIASFRQSNAVTTAAEHGVHLQGLCLAMSAKWCSLVDQYLGSRLTEQVLVDRNRLEALQTRDAIKSMATTQGLASRKMAGNADLVRTRTQLANLVAAGLAHSSEHIAEVKSINDAIDDFKQELNHCSSEKWLYSLITEESGMPPKQKLYGEWEAMANLMTTRGPKIVGFPTYGGHTGLGGHAIAAFTLPNGETLFFDPNFGEYIATRWDDKWQWFEAMRRIYDPHGEGMKERGCPFVYSF